MERYSPSYQAGVAGPELARDVAARVASRRGGRMTSARQSIGAQNPPYQTTGNHSPSNVDMISGKEVGRIAGTRNCHVRNGSSRRAGSTWHPAVVAGQ